jgi:hypothetical protein
VRNDFRHRRVLASSPHEYARHESFHELMELDWRDVRDRTTWSPEAQGSAGSSEDRSAASTPWPLAARARTVAAQQRRESLRQS